MRQVNILASLCTYFVVASILCPDVNSSDVRVLSKFEIIQPEPGTSSKLGVAGGLQHCGGPGRVIQIRYETCNWDSPCKIFGDGKPRRAELEFIPSQNISTLGIRLNIITDSGSKEVLDHPISDSTVCAGQTYYSVGYGGVNKELIGQYITVQWILYQVVNNNVEVCGETTHLVVEPPEN